jgi:PAS domain S-box-containing protein
MEKMNSELNSHMEFSDNVYKKMVGEIQDYAIILLDINGHILTWNQGAQKIKQYTEEEILGKHFSQFYFEEDVKKNIPQQLLNEAKVNGRAVHEGWRKRKDGSKFWGSVTITALHDENNTVTAFCKVTRDLTDKKLAEDALRLSEERYHQMVAEVQDYAIILLDKEGKIQNWNAGAEFIKGYKANEVVGKSFEIFYTEADRKGGLPFKLLNVSREEGKALQEGWRVRKDGTMFWGTIVITALHNKEGEVIGFSKVTRDLTERKLSEEKMLEYTAELEIQNGELEQFAFVASHDLQEPLRKIQTFTELIQENLEDSDFVKTYFAKLDASARRMAELVKSLLNFSRLSKSADDKSLISRIDLNTIIDEVKEDFELLIEEKKAVILCNDIPTIEANRLQIGQLFSNLISNSLKFSTVLPVIKIQGTVVNKEELPDLLLSSTVTKFHKIDFTDNGIGFEQQYDKVIFSLFQRLHGKQDFAGTGIGLALCKKVAENHGGTITASSELGKGAKFSVYLPFRD